MLHSTCPELLIGQAKSASRRSDRRTTPSSSEEVTFRSCGSRGLIAAKMRSAIDLAFGSNSEALISVDGLGRALVPNYGAQ